VVWWRLGSVPRGVRDGELVLLRRFFGGLSLTIGVIGTTHHAWFSSDGSSSKE
jgi:nitric oxide reductase large subunit